MLFPFICVSLSQLELTFCTMEVGSVLTYYLCIMTCHTANCLKQSSLTISQFLYVKSADVAQLSYLLRIPLGDFKMLVQLCYHLKLSIFSKLTGCWQNSFPAGCVTEVQVFFASCWLGTALSTSLHQCSGRVSATLSCFFQKSPEQAMPTRSNLSQDELKVG